MNNTIYRKAMENVRNRINAKLVNNKKDYLKCKLKLSYMLRKIFHNKSVGIRKIELSLKLKDPACIGICMLYLK